MPERVVARPVVLGAVDDAGLDRRIDLAVRHRRGIGAERVHHVDEDVGLDDAELHALEIRRRVDRLLGIVEGARAGIVEGERHQAVRLERLQDLVADRAVHRLVHVIDRAEDEGQGRDGGFGNEIVERPHIDAVQIDHAEPGLLDRVLLLAELRRVEDLHLEAPVGSLLEQSAEIFHRLDGRIAVRVDVGGAKGGLGINGAARQRGQQSDSGCRQSSSGQHSALLGFLGGLAFTRRQWNRSLCRWPDSRQRGPADAFSRLTGRLLYGSVDNDRQQSVKRIRKQGEHAFSHFPRIRSATH